MIFFPTFLILVPLLELTIVSYVSKWGELFPPFSIPCSWHNAAVNGMLRTESKETLATFSCRKLFRSKRQLVCWIAFLQWNVREMCMGNWGFLARLSQLIMAILGCLWHCTKRQWMWSRFTFWIYTPPTQADLTLKISLLDIHFFHVGQSYRFGNGLLPIERVAIPPNKAMSLIQLQYLPISEVVRIRQ